MPSPASPTSATPSRRREDGLAATGAIGLAAALIAVGSRHEAWFDEAQAWLLARDSTFTDLLLERLHYEGSPGLWHALLWLAAHAGYPFAALWLISSALAVSSAFLILRAAPFPVWLRFGLIGSYFFAYQYSVVARSYALDLLLVPLAAALFPGRASRPLPYAIVLGLLANTNAHSFIVAGTLCAEWLCLGLRAGTWRRPAFLGSMGVFAFFALCAVLQAWPAADVSFGAAGVNVDRADRLLGEAFVGRVRLGTEAVPVPIQRLAVLLILLPSSLLFLRAKTFILVGSLVIGLMVFSALQHANLWHSGILFLVWIFGLWISWPALHACSRGLRGCVLASVAGLVLLQDVQTAAAWIREMREPYSSGREAAALVRAARLRDPAARVAAVGFKAFSIQPWFARNVFANYVGGASDPAFYSWDRRQSFPPRAELGSFRAVLAAGYELIALSTDLPPGPDLDAYEAAGSEKGYCVTATIDGHLIWKTDRVEEDGIVLFAKCRRAHGAAGCARADPAIGCESSTPRLRSR